MGRKAKIKSNYKASGSSVDLYCSVHVRRTKARTNHGARSVLGARNGEGGDRIEFELRDGGHDGYPACAVFGRGYLCCTAGILR